jgi:polyhydroxyalkanoate synthesis regulator phasin
MELSETARKLFLAGVGAVAETAEKSKKIIDELVDKGELSVEEGKKLNEELKHKCSDGEKKKSLMDAVGSMTQEERDALRKKLDLADAGASEKKDA